MSGSDAIGDASYSMTAISHYRARHSDRQVYKIKIKLDVALSMRIGFFKDLNIMKKEFLVKNFEKELLSHKTRKSPKRLNELLADSFFEFSQSWWQSNKKSVIENLLNCDEEKFFVRNYRETSLSPDTVLVNYVADTEIIHSWVKRCTLCSSIWQHIEWRWQMIFFQGTPSKEYK